MALGTQTGCGPVKVSGVVEDEGAICVCSGGKGTDYSRIPPTFAIRRQLEDGRLIGDAKNVSGGVQS